MENTWFIAALFTYGVLIEYVGKPQAYEKHRLLNKITFYLIVFLAAFLVWPLLLGAVVGHSIKAFLEKEEG